MENPTNPKRQEIENNGHAFPGNSPTSNGSIPRSESNPSPTTFVHAHSSNFKQVVQMLTGSSETARQASKDPNPSKQDLQSSSPSAKSPIPPKKQGFKLYERRNIHQLKNGLVISPFIPKTPSVSGFSPLSPSMLDFPKLALASPVNESPFPNSLDSTQNSIEEEKAIAEKGFYLHPSPRTTPRDAEPRLLPLFPVESPRGSGSSS